MKSIVIVGLLLLAGCTAPQPAWLSGQSGAEAPGYSTLADANDPIDMAAAPVVTRLALYTHDVAKALTAGKISRQYAIQARDDEHNLRAVIERAVASRDMALIGRAATTVDEYAKDLENMK